MTSLRTTLLLVAALAAGAILQGLTALSGYATAGPGWGWMTGLSALLLVAQAWVASIVAVGLAGARPVLLRAAVWSAIVVVIGVAVAVVFPLGLVLFMVVAPPILSAAAAGRSLRAAAAVLRHTPARVLLVVLLSLALSALSWVAAVASGFFVTGLLGGIAMWTFFSLAGAVQLLVWARIDRVALSRDTPSSHPAAP